MRRIVVLLFTLIFFVPTSCIARPWTVRHTIETSNVTSRSKYSPDSKSFIIVTCKGVLSTNETESTIWLFNTEKVRAFCQHSPGVHDAGATVKPQHSDSIVVIDRDGNIAAITHTINAVIWGDTGIVVDGIPIPDSAGFQQPRLATITPGDRVPHSMNQTIVFKNDKPVFATAAIGASGTAETVENLLLVLGKNEQLANAQSAPPLIYNFTHLNLAGGDYVADRGISIPEDYYSDEYLKKLSEYFPAIHRISKVDSTGLRGTVTAATINAGTGEKSSCETKGALVFADAY